MELLEMRTAQKVLVNSLSVEFLRKFYALLALSFSFLWLATDGSTALLQKLLIVSFLFLAFSDKKIRQDALFWGSLLLIAFFSLEFIWHALSLPEAIFANRFPSKYINFFCFFLLIAYGTVVWKRFSPFYILIGAAAGFLAFLILYSPINEWRLSWEGTRVGFGFRNAQHAGIFFGAGLLGISFFGPRIFKAYSGFTRLILALAVFAFAGLMIYGIIATQVRAVWIALILAFLAGGTAYLFTTTINSLLAWFRDVKHMGLVVLLISSVIALGSALSVQQRIQHRIGQENISIQTVQGAARFEGQRLTSSGIRVALWSASASWIETRPMLGWGSLSVERLIGLDSRFNSQFKQKFGHLHNSTLELLVAVGAIGLFSIGVLIMMLAIKILKARRVGAMPKDVFVFAWAFLVFWGIVNCFESYINYSSGFYLNSIIASFLYAFYLQCSFCADA
jgi:O-antigen ligase